MNVTRRDFLKASAAITGALALKASGLEQATVVHRPRLLSDNGSSYISGDLATWLGDRDIQHIRSAKVVHFYTGEWCNIALR